ncbi:MAG: DUF4340 domain-containing protein [Thiohalocapsa sp.]|nr:DUF4340 domain-containing protein [Thiohalocapsa sp.]
MAARENLAMLLRRWLINAGLLVVVAVLAAAATLEGEQADAQTRLTPLPAAEIERIRLQRAGEPAIVLERAALGWRMREPYPAAADDAQLRKLLPVAEARTQRTLPAAVVDAGALGLQQPAIRLWLDDLELRFGGTEPVAGLRYVQVGDLVHVIEDSHLPQLLAPVEDYLSRRLLPPGFSPGIGSIDGRPLTADMLARLVDVQALAVEPLGDRLSGQLLSIASADGGEDLRFLVTDAGTRWSRLDQRLSYVFTTPPIAEIDEDTGFALPAEEQSTGPMRSERLLPDDTGGDAPLLDEDAPMPTRKLSP